MSKKQALQNKLTNLAAILQYTNATIIRSQAGLGYSCFFCDKTFSKPAELKGHTLKDHTAITKSNCFKILSLSFKNVGLVKFMVMLDITGLQCYLCQGDIDNLEDLQEHLKTDHNKKLYEDSNCSFLPFKFNTEELRCFKCMEMFTAFKTLQEHMNIHYRNFVCGVCEAGFLTLKQLRSHEKTHDNGEFSCNYCSKVFNTNQNRKYHERIVHSEVGKGMYRCSLCDKTFKYHRGKQHHLVEAHGAPEQSIKCEACDKVFLYRKQYQIHYNRHHLLLKPHQCLICDKRFSNTSDLKSHVVTHTGTKPYVCEVCSKAFALKKTLNLHMKIHNNDRRFQCGYCEHAFVQKCSLKLHLYNKHGQTLE